MNALPPRLIAIGFYDGPTEGFVRGFANGFDHYFKVVAWDDEQDRRLYLLGRLDERLFDQLLALLSRRHKAISSAVLTPAWEFSDSECEEQANEFVEEGRRTLNSPALSILGSSLLEECEVVNPTQLQLNRAIALAQLQSPGSLGEWLALGT